MAVPVCRFCQTGPSQQTVKGEYVYGGTLDQHFWECGNCGMIYLDPPLSAEEEQEFYRKEFEKFMDKRSGRDKDWDTPAGHFSSSQGEADRRMRFLGPHLRPGMKVLEIGCSSGFMLDRLRHAECEVYGVDPSEVFIEFARSKDLPVFSSIDELRAVHKTRFDLVTHFYVLEHIANPVDFIKHYMNMLKPSGKMIFEVPNASDPLVTLYKVPAFDKFYWSCAHHWYFRKESLQAVLDKAGYKCELLPEQRYDLSNHMIWMRDGKPGGMGHYKKVFGDQLDDLYRQRLKETWMCDTIRAVVYQ